MITAAIAMLTLGGLGFLVVLVRGPSLADRVVALDGLLTISVMIIAAYGALIGSVRYVAVSVVVALVAFVGTATFARYIERRGG
jgi:multicomponent Na+:H+ antiporter subunit F